MALRPRFWWTTLLVLVALGGAGLAVAADRPHNPVQRPELTWRADRAAALWIAELSGALRTVEERVVELSTAGRRVLGATQTLDVGGTDAAIVDGESAASALQDEIARVRSVREASRTAVTDWRLGPGTRDVLARIDVAMGSVGDLPQQWETLESVARLMASLLNAIRRHDGAVFDATQAGRDARWGDAVRMIEDAAEPLDDARGVRDELAADGRDVGTLDDLLRRYAGYDDAVRALYTYVRDTGRQQGREFAALEAAVAAAQQTLPRDNSVLSLIVAEAAGPTITGALGEIEAARGHILDALAAAEQPAPSPQP